MKIKTKDSIAEIEGELPWADLERHRAEVLEELRQDFQAPGFRKGKVPMEEFLKRVNEHHVLEDAAERALQEAYPRIVEEHNLEPLGRPEVTITKLAAGNPLGFRVRVGVMPEVKLPNYQKIAREVMDSHPPAEIKPEDVEKVIDDLRRLRAGKGPEDKTDLSDLPEFTDEFVKTLGAFENVADFRTKLAENLKVEKENETRRERREKIAEALGNKTKMTLPATILDAEAEAMQERLAADLERSKMPLEDYLAKSGKTAEGLLSEHRSYAERQLKTRFILEAIAKAEGLEADQQELAAELHYLRAQHPQTDPEVLARYAESLLRNEKVLRFLEGEEIKASELKN